MIKKLIKWFLCGALIAALAAAAGVFALYKMYPPEKLKAKVQQYVAKNWNREITFEEVSFTWIGIKVKGVALSENTTFADGTFIKAEELTAHVAVKPLLKKRVEISAITAKKLDVQIIQRADGTFNFDSLMSQNDNPPAGTDDTDPQASADLPVVITAQKIVLDGCNFSYSNEQTGMKLALNNLNIQITRFDLEKPFQTVISFTSRLAGLTQPAIEMPVTLQFETFLANLNWPQAYANLTQAKAQYKTVQFAMQGSIQNLQAPQVNLTGTLKGIDNQVLAVFAPDLPDFALPTLNLALQANADLDKSNAQITLAKVSVQHSDLSAGGEINWAAQTPSYRLAGKVNANINELVQMTQTGQDFQPAGTVTGTFQASDKKNYTDVNANLALQQVSLLYPPFTLSQVQGNVVIDSLDNIYSNDLHGKLNQEAFTAKASYRQAQNVTDVALTLNLDKLLLTQWPQSNNQTAAAGQTPAQAAQETAAPTNRMNLQADVTVGKIKVPYLEADGLSINARLTDITDTLEHLNGTLTFALSPGKITNLDNFIKDSKIAKIILLPVSVVKKVAGVLNLNLFPADTTGNGTTVAYTQAQGTYTFTDGIMNVDETVFKSSVTDIEASGSANFKTEELAMKATATLLTQAAPVVIKITGTLSNPKGKVDVLNTVTSVVGGLINGTALKSAANGSVNLTKSAAQTGVNVVKGTAQTGADVVK